MMLISAKVNQWTLLIGSLPLAHLAGGGSGVLHLDPRQVEEVLLTATQTVLGVAILLALCFPRWAAWALLGLFAVQFAIPSTTGRLVLCGVHLVLGLGALVGVAETLARAVQQGGEILGAELVVPGRGHQHLRDVRSAAHHAHPVVDVLVLPGLEAQPPAHAGI
ncbi:MAG: hypothetical protein ACTH2Q_09125, partial [Propionibacteriaceae bacterium]